MKLAYSMNSQWDIERSTGKFQCKIDQIPPHLKTKTLQSDATFSRHDKNIINSNKSFKYGKYKRGKG